MNKYLALLATLIFVGASSSSFADDVQSGNGSLTPSTTQVEMTRGGGGFHGGGGHGGGYHGGGNHGGGYHGGGNHGGYHGGNGGYHGGYHGGYGHVSRPVVVRFGRAPYGGWRGHRYVYGGVPYAVWAWGPWSPWYNWGYYEGWRLGLGYYVPDGLRCTATNTQVAGEWFGPIEYYSSDDAINAALDVCKNDPYVVNAGAQAACRIKTCSRWEGRSGD